MVWVIKYAEKLNTGQRHTDRAKIQIEFISLMALRQYNDCFLNSCNEHTEQYEHSEWKYIKSTSFNRNSPST